MTTTPPQGAPTLIHVPCRSPSPRSAPARPLTLGAGEADHDMPGVGAGPQLTLAAARALMALEVAEQLLPERGRRLGGAPVPPHQHGEGARPLPLHGCPAVLCSPLPAAVSLSLPCAQGAAFPGKHVPVVPHCRLSP